jgi:protein-disulfide isomerase
MLTTSWQLRYNAQMEPQINMSEEQKNLQKETEKKVSTMSTPVAVLVGAIIIAISIFITFGQKGTTQKTNTGTTAPTVSIKEALKLKSTDHIRGDISKAEVVVIEYSDSDCSFCQRFHPTLLQLMNEYQGKMAWVYRHFPLSIHPNAYNEALALECVANLGGNGAFTSYLDEVMNKTFQHGEQFNVELVTMATKLGIEEKAFRNCIADPKIAKIIDADIAQATGVGAQGTPFSIVFNTKTKKSDVIPGAYPIEEVKKTLAELAK